MLLFQNISNFNNIKDYLPILNGAIITDLVVIFMLEQKYIKSTTLKEWYNKFHLGAFIADVLSIVIGLLIARFIYTTLNLNWKLWLFIILVILVQLTHDLLFAKLFYSFPRKVSAVLDVFKDYANEMGTKILLADAQMVTSTALLASLLSNMNQNSNIILLIFLMYITPYFLFSV
jgi:uncharacterized protein YacL